jgi:phage-related protein
MEAAAAAWEFIQGVVETVTSVISTVFAAFKLAFEGDWEGFGETLRTAWDTAWEFIKTTFTNAKDTIIGIAAGLVLDLIAKFQDTDWKAVGTAIIQGIANGISAGAGAIADAARAAAQAALDAAKGFLGIQSPSRVAMQQIGEPFTEGLAIGLGDVGPVQRSVADLVNELTLPFGSVNPTISTTGTATAVSSPTPTGGGPSTTINIDARGTDAPTIDRLRGIIRDELASSGRRADVRIRTG